MVLPPLSCSSVLFLSPTLPIVGLRLALILYDCVAFFTILITAMEYSVVSFLPGIIYLWEETDKLCRQMGSEKVKFDAPKLLGYRELQVLEKLLNDCVKSRIFLVVAITFPMLQVVTSFIVIRADAGMDVAIFVYFGVLMMDAVILNLALFTGAAKIYGGSAKILRKWRGNVFLSTQSKLEKRVLMSICPLRLYFGSNYVDNLTPIVIQAFCSCQTVNLLLLM